MINAIKNLIQKTGSGQAEKNVVEAYDLWSESYDFQPGNLMLDLDEVVFAGLLENVDLQNKVIADVGCGTGRHWPKLYQKQPSLVMGFDVSQGMLNQLTAKYPRALTYHTSDNRMLQVPDHSVDCLISTLTVAHIKNIEEAIRSWSRVLKSGADLIITDFHPDLLARGGKRSFNHDGKPLSVTNYVHPLHEILTICKKFSMDAVQQVEKLMNEDVRHYYESQFALAVYDRFKGLPIIYGIRLKKKIGTE